MFRPIIVVLLVSLSFAVADTTLYIPGFDDQPVSVTDVGVDPEGRTTWLIQPGQKTGTVPPAPFPITATMVQGPSDAVIQASFPQMQISLSCALKSGLANCVGNLEEGGGTITTSLQETVKPFLVQGGGSGGASSPPNPTPAPTRSGSGSTSGGGGDYSSAAVTAVTGIGVLVRIVVAGMATLFLV